MLTQAAVIETTITPEWRKIVKPYEAPDIPRSVRQVITTFLAFGAMLYAMNLSLALPYWATLVLAVPTAAFLVRAFVLMHDCTHRSLFRRRWMNETIGWITGVLLLTPYKRWQREHVLHHATTGDLDRRGDGDVWMMTLREYREATPLRRLFYRLVRNPLVFLTIGPVKFAVSMRFYPPGRADGPVERDNVRETNLALLALFLGFAALIGPMGVIAIYAPVYMIATSTAGWLIYLQHQFEDAYWADHEHWDYATAAIKGSSYLRLPAWLDWITGSVGFHHVHHLSPRIPNYKLRDCHVANELFQGAHTITLWDSARTLRLTLWDEERGRVVGFDAA